MSKRLEILKVSLEKKNSVLDANFENHFATVKQANGQPLNDKRNGQATLNKWAKQEDGIRSQMASVEKTERAIENEEWKIKACESVKATLPAQILALIESGDLIQWRKHPHMFFVNGVDRARIVWDNKKKVIAHKCVGEITDQEQYSKFARLFNELRKSLL